ncbi:MAG TPA: Npt1/Npt2 family nucleotide transporter [Anaerolineales bacterium]|nr:Npt1/Npt2 family nucleotide transporter [Anaerolineales bacterium]
MTISMFKDQLIAFLKIRPEETRMVVLMAGLFLCVQSGQGIGENAAFALFLSSINVNFLPYMYMGLGGVVFVASIAYSASLSRFQNANVIKRLLAGSALLFAIEWLLIAVFRNSISYPLLWLTTYGMGVVFGTLLWTSAGEVCDARQAKRLFPLFTSMGILGSVIGNLLTGVIASFAGAEGLILFYAILLGAGFLLVRSIARAYFKPEAETNVPFSLIKDVRAGYDFVSRSQLFRLVAVSSILYSILFFTVDFPFSERISETYVDNAAGLAGFKGLFTSVTTVVTFLVSLLLANRMYTRLGIVNSVLVMPIMYIVAFVLFFISFNFWGAVGARFGQLVILGGVGGTAWNALFNVVPPERRGQVLAFNSGVPSQVGVVFSGVLILLSRRVLGTQDILLLGAFVALIATYVTMRMRPAYGEALLSALRAGRTEVFSDQEDAFSGYKNDPSALQVILKAMRDSRVETRRLAAEMLGRMGSLLAAPDLIERLTDDDASVRAAATKALADLGAKPAYGEIILGLDDPDDSVRGETLASLPKLGVDSSPELIRTLGRLLKDRNVRIRAHAAVVLVYLGEVKSAQTLLSRLLKSDELGKRLTALEAIRHIAGNVSRKFPIKTEFILSALEDPSPLIRREAIRILAVLKDTSHLDLVTNRLGDKNAGVRQLALESLKQIWPESRAGVLQILEKMNQKSLDAALDSIPPGDPDVLDALRAYIQHEVSTIWYLRMLINSFSMDGRAVSLLVETLKHRERLSEDRLIKAVGLFGNRRAMEIVRKSLNAGDAGARAAALEALETLGDPTITKDVLPILDRGGVFIMDSDHKMDASVVIGGLLESKDYWLRAIAARVVQELGLKEYIPLLKKMKSDSVVLVRHAVLDVLAGMDGGAKMKTLKTLSTLDRILLLREVPMFSHLSPEDLEQIAESAQEQLFPSESVICREGDPGDSLFIIVQGMVNVIKKTENDQTILAVRKSGEFAGEMAILESSMRSATLQAAIDVRMLVLDGDSFKAILRDRPEVAISVLQHMSRRVRELNERVGMMA